PFTLPPAPAPAPAPTVALKPPCGNQRLVLEETLLTTYLSECKLCRSLTRDFLVFTFRELRYL
ncbi:MAG TPA: hypothetical protein P5182_05835, partial [Myxococcota bacterium]|nr:hypothetical protein [Myxococcota bacterium]